MDVESTCYFDFILIVQLNGGALPCFVVFVLPKNHPIAKGKSSSTKPPWLWVCLPLNFSLGESEIGFIIFDFLGDLCFFGGSTTPALNCPTRALTVCWWPNLSLWVWAVRRLPLVVPILWFPPQLWVASGWWIGRWMEGELWDGKVAETWGCCSCNDCWNYVYIYIQIYDMICRICDGVNFCGSKYKCFSCGMLSSFDVIWGGCE